MEKYKKTISNIKNPDKVAMEKARERLDNLTKPPGSLGQLEEIAVKIAGISGNSIPNIENKAHIVMVGDHGVVEEGVSAFPGEVTTSMVKNFLNGGAAINVLTTQMDVDLILVDIGMKDTVESEEILNYKVKKGTDNITRGPAMSFAETVEAIETGITITEDIIKKGADVIGTGEMGIGNTTPSSAILAVLTDYPLPEIVGPGTGLKPEKVRHKINIIKKSLCINNPDPQNPLDVLACVGGLEIAGMTGCILGAAANRTPVVIDGLISGAAALIASKIKPETVNYMLPSHVSAEPGHIKIYKYLGLSPLLNLDMRLGEGTGAVLAINLIEAAGNIINKMATFAEAGIIR